jgi:3-oxoacyl-[acyl-carrier-protein] synthase-3
MSIYLHNLSVFLGDQTFTVEETESRNQLIAKSAGFREAGFSQHRMSSDNQSALDLAIGAIEPIRSELSKTDLIVYATCITMNGNIGTAEKFQETRDVKHLMNYPASHVQTHFELEQATVVGLNQQACTSMLGSLRLAKAFLTAESQLQKVLCVSADRFPKGSIYEQAYNLISDGAACCLVSREPKGYKILETHAITNGALVDANDDEVVGCYFAYTHQLVHEVLDKAGLTAKDINWVVPQNTNITAWTILSQLLSIPIERVFFKTIHDYGHIISSDNIANLIALEKTGDMRSGDKVLMFMAGYGMNWQAVLLEKV